MVGKSRKVALATGASSGMGKEYVVGKHAKPMICMRTWLGDRIFDWMMRRMITTQMK